MTPTPLPQLDVARIRTWCQQRVPERALHQVRVDSEITEHQMIIVERRAPWSEDSGAEWIRRPIAQFTYDPSTARWTLSSFDSDGRARRYSRIAPAATVADLLAELDHDPTGAFWG